MVCRCVAAGCSKTHKDGVGLFDFPKDASLRADQVRRTRDKWHILSCVSCTSRTRALSKRENCQKLWVGEKKATLKGRCCTNFI